MATDMMEKAYRIYFDNAYQAAETQFEWAKWCSWAGGAIMLEVWIETIPEFPAIPKKIDIAKSVLELLMQPMITLWCHNWEKQELTSAEKMIEARQNSFQNVQALLGTPSSEVTSINMVLDVEFTYLLNKMKESSYDYFGMFHQRYRECVLQKRIVEWKKVKPPIEDWVTDFMNLCKKNEYKGLSFEHSLALYSIIPDAQRSMFDDFQKKFGREKINGD